MIKKIVSAVLIAVILICIFVVPSIAHSGGTDANGGHYDSTTGKYHYHCGGYPAHQHTNGVCPYSGDSNNSEDEGMEGGGLLYNALLAGTVGVIITGIVALIKWLIKGGKKKEPIKVQSKTQNNGESVTPKMTKAERERYKAIANTIIDGTEMLKISAAKTFAEKKDLLPNFEKNKELLSNDIKLFALNKDSQKIIEELTVYYVYDIYGKLKNLFLTYKPEAGNLKNLNDDKDYLMLKCQIMTYLEQFPPKEETTEDYISMIMDLFFAPNDYERCDILAEHGREIPERVKKMLNNDKQALIEHWFGTIILKIKTYDFKYFLRNGVTTLDLAIFCCYKTYLLFCQEISNTEKAAEFTKIFTKIFIEYASENEFKAENIAEDFFFTRIEAYEKIVMSKDEEKIDYLIYCCNQFIAKDLNGNPLDDNVVLEPINPAYLRTTEIEIFSEELLENTMDLFTTILDSFR